MTLLRSPFTKFYFRSFDEFAFHLHTNTVGPIILASKLLQTNIPIGTITFLTSDSGSATNFRDMEDGCVLRNKIKKSVSVLTVSSFQICCVCCFEGCLESHVKGNDV